MGQDLSLILIFFFEKASLQKLLPFYKDIFINWKTHFSSSLESPAGLPSQFLWFSKYTQIEGNLVYVTKFAAKNINVLSQLLEEGNLKPWDDLKLECNVTSETCFQWLQVKHAISHKWSTVIKQSW